MTDPISHKSDQSLPIDDCDLGQLFASFEPHDRIAIGVSGGADSMALMHLLARWRKIRAGRGDPSPDILVLSVDHGLRNDARSEAEFVGEQAKLLGFEHVILTWVGHKPDTGVQDAARRARYRLMTAAALEGSCTALVVAHHAQDQAETLLMRLARGSGIDGLAGMAAVSHREGIELHRPFLNVSKMRLKASLEQLGARWVDDPSNENDIYERIRIRKVMALLEPLGVSHQGLALSAGRLTRARQALDGQTRSAKVSLVKWHDGAYGEINGAGFLAQPDEIRLRLLGDVIVAFGGCARSPQLSKLETTLMALDGAAEVGGRFSASFSRSLGGTLIRINGGSIHVFREPARGDIETLPLNPGGKPVIWDGRFEVSLASGTAEGGNIYIGALGEDGLAYLKRQDWKYDVMPREALLALPALKRERLIVAVPHLNYWGGDAGSCGLSASSLDIGFISGIIKP